MATAHTVLLKGRGVQKEAAAGGAITPGMLINYTTSSTVVVHASADANAVPMFALENEDVGKDLNSAYASGEQTRFILPERGAEIYALLPASAAAVVVGDLLASNGAGYLKKTAAPTVAITNVTSIVARALEAVDNSGGGSPVRIRVEVV